MTLSVEKKHYPACPDGGWGWAVVFGSFMIHVLADGVIYSFGLFYYEIAKHFGASKAVTSMVVSIMNGTTYCIGPIASALTIKFGCRAVTISGAICASLGFLLSIFATNIYVLYFTIGICAGFGFGLMYLPAIVIVTSYFEKRRAFATGIAVCGSGIGTAIMSPLIEYLIFLFGWKGAMLIISCLMLNCAIFGCLFKPLPTNTANSFDTKQCETITEEIDEEKLDLNVTVLADDQELSCNYFKDNEHDNLSQINLESALSPRLSLPHEDDIKNSLCLPNCNGNVMTKSLCSVQVFLNDHPIPESPDSKQRSQSFSPGFLYRKDIFYSGSLMNIPKYHSNHVDPRFSKPKKSKIDCFLFRWLNFSEEIMDNFSEMIDLTLMKNYIFLIFLISNFWTSVGYHIPFIYLKDRIMELNVASAQETGVFTSIIGIFSTISRLVFGYLSDHSFVNRLWLYLISVTLCGVVIMFNSLATTYYAMAIFCALFGITCGTYVSLTSVVLVDLLGLEKLTNAFGLILLFQGVASFVGPPLIGFTYDLYGSYDVGFYITGAIVAFSGIMLILIDFTKYFKSFKKLLRF